MEFTTGLWDFSGVYNRPVGLQWSLLQAWGTLMVEFTTGLGDFSGGVYNRPVAL